MKNGEIRVLRDSLKQANQEKEQQRQTQLTLEKEKAHAQSEREKELSRKVRHSLTEPLKHSLHPAKCLLRCRCSRCSQSCTLKKPRWMKWEGNFRALSAEESSPAHLHETCKCSFPFCLSSRENGNERPLFCGLHWLVQHCVHLCVSFCSYKHIMFHWI